MHISDSKMHFIRLTYVVIVNADLFFVSLRVMCMCGVRAGVCACERYFFHVVGVCGLRGQVRPRSERKW